MSLTVAKSPDAFRTISEAADELGVPQHVLRFWETKFSFIRPMKRAGGRRFYRRQDIEVLRGVRILLHDEGYTIKGVQKLLREQGGSAVINGVEPESREPAPNAMPEPASTRPLPFDDMHNRVEPSFAQARVAPTASGSNGTAHHYAIDINALRAILSELREAEKMLTLARAN